MSDHLTTPQRSTWPFLPRDARLSILEVDDVMFLALADGREPAQLRCFDMADEGRSLRDGWLFLAAHAWSRHWARCWSEHAAAEGSVS